MIGLIVNNRDSFNVRFPILISFYAYPTIAPPAVVPLHLVFGTNKDPLLLDVGYNNQCKIP